MSGTVYERPEGSGRWTAHAYWSDESGRRRQRKKGGFGSKMAAHQALTDIQRNLDLGVRVHEAACDGQRARVVEADSRIRPTQLPSGRVGPGT
jgi:hypothetical protein